MNLSSDHLNCNHVCIAMGGGKGKKKMLMQNKQLIFKNMLKTKPTPSFAKSTDTDTKQMIIDAKPAVILH